MALVDEKIQRNDLVQIRVAVQFIAAIENFKRRMQGHF